MNKSTKFTAGRLCMGLVSAMLFSTLASAVEPERPVSDIVSSRIFSQASNAENIKAFPTSEPLYSLSCIEICYETTGDWTLCVAMCSGGTNQ